MNQTSVKIIRCFIALELPESVRQSLGKTIGDLAATGADVKWVDPGNIHLTLKFLGEIPEANLIRIGLALAGLRGALAAVTTRLSGLGTFPPTTRPRVVWAGLDDAGGRLNNIHQEVERKTAGLGIAPEERPFAPHLTLGRVRSHKNNQELLARLQGAALAADEFTINRLTLFKSTLTPKGSIYDPLNAIELV